MDVNGSKVVFHPVFEEALKDAVELDENRIRLQTVMESNVFNRIMEIVESQPVRKRSAYYGTIYEAVCAGYDFSRVKSLNDIGDIYAQFIIRKTFE